MAYSKEKKERHFFASNDFKEIMTLNARKVNSNKNPNGYIYIIKLKGFDLYKIGVSNNPKRRIYDIDSSSPFGVDLIGTYFFVNVYNMEECIHDSFKKNKFRKEWFKIHHEDIFVLKNQLKDFSDNGIYLNKK